MSIPVSVLIPEHLNKSIEADVFVIAAAQAKGLKIIGDETKYVQPIDIHVARKISIRNVCENIDVAPLTFLEFIKDHNGNVNRIISNS